MIRMDFLQKLKKYEEEVEYIDVRILEEKRQNLRLENGELTEDSISESFSFGVRVLVDGKLGFAGSTDPELFDEVVRKAIKLARISEKKIKFPFLSNRAIVKANFKIDPFTIDEREKIKFLLDFSKRLEGKDFIKSTSLNLNFSRGTEEFYSSFGSEIKQEFIRSGFRAYCVGRINGELQYSSFSYYRNRGYEFLRSINVEKETKGLSEKLLKLLKGKRLKGGRYDVICDNKLTGVFFHEAVGHACEADLVLKGESILRNKFGKKIAISDLNLVDNPLVEEYGKYRFDHEGVKGRKKYLIKGGKLVNFLHSLETAAQMGHEPTGNGRAESPLFLPLPRMSNIVIEPGDWKKDEIIEETKIGVYAVDSRGGEVNTSTGDFVFNAKEAYLIKNGEIRECIKDFSILGNILNTLQNIVAIGRDVKHPHTGGWCGKDGQHVNVGEVAPHVKIRGVIVGSG